MWWVDESKYVVGGRVKVCGGWTSQSMWWVDKSKYMVVGRVKVCGVAFSQHPLDCVTQNCYRQQFEGKAMSYSSFNVRVNCGFPLFVRFHWSISIKHFSNKSRFHHRNIGYDRNLFIRSIAFRFQLCFVSFSSGFVLFCRCVFLLYGFLIRN